ncbi:MAG: RNA 2',3'-cyclic phosphodiesterase [Thaumarchaeota archaeon]|nr:RNA 2',3'-cyclic phosphodiesterase [Nitrososphaerota archaeon]
MRTFVAIELHDENVLDKIGKTQSEFKIKATPVQKHNMHFTLLFLGETSDEYVEKVKKELSTVTFSPIKVRFTHVGAFPNPRYPRVVWVGVDDEAGKKLVELAQQVEKKLKPLGFKSDKPFRPHLTIFRIRNKTDITNTIDKFKDVDFGTSAITELKFKQSVLTPSGPIYSDLQVVLAK